MPTRRVLRDVEALARDCHATAIVVDAGGTGLGLLVPRLSTPVIAVLHGGVVAQARIPGARGALARVLAASAHVVCAGQFPAREARRAAGTRLPPLSVVPPGVDSRRFVPLSDDARGVARAHFGLPADGKVVLSVSRLVPRKGMDVLIDVAPEVARRVPDLTVAIAGGGRDRGRLERRARRGGADIRFLGRVADSELPGLYACADVFAMLCRARWAGLEQEGFGMVFAEAMACGVPCVAGRSGGSADAVEHGATGLVVDDPRDRLSVAAALIRLLADDRLRAEQGIAAREHAVHELDMDLMARRMEDVIRSVARGGGPLTSTA